MPTSIAYPLGGTDSHPPYPTGRYRPPITNDPEPPSRRYGPTGAGSPVVEALRVLGRSTCRQPVCEGTASAARPVCEGTASAAHLGQL